MYDVGLTSQKLSVFQIVPAQASLSLPRPYINKYPLWERSLGSIRRLGLIIVDLPKADRVENPMNYMYLTIVNNIPLWLL